MYVKSDIAHTCVTACALLLGLAGTAAGTGLRVTVTQQDGGGFEGAVVIAEPAMAVPRGRKNVTIMDQKSLMFVPEIIVIRTGSDVDFPNSDQVRHQVYSFSGAKRFQLSLYAGRQYEPVNFDKPGLVTLGCNIHDSMIGYIYVTDSPWFGRTGADGSVTLSVPPGDYTVTVQHPRIVDAATALRRALTVGASDATTGFMLTKAVRLPSHVHGADKKWEDY
jgi:plastocyanin